MPNKLKNQTALITGVTAGISWACAVGNCGRRRKPRAYGLRQERLNELTALVKEKGVGTVKSLAGDAAEESSAQQCIDLAMKETGSLDILINNVGSGIYKNLADTSVEDYDTMVASNVRSTFLFSRFAVPHMIEKKAGTILMISSMAGVYGFPGEAVYCSTKFA